MIHSIVFGKGIIMAWGISLNHTLMYGTRIVRITYSSFCSMSKDGVNMVRYSQLASYIQRYRAVHGHVAIFARRVRVFVLVLKGLMK